MTTKLYLIEDTHDDEDTSLFVEARNPHEAVLLWRNHNDYIPSAIPEMVIEVPLLTGKPGSIKWEDVTFCPVWLTLTPDEDAAP